MPLVWVSMPIAASFIKLETSQAMMTAGIFQLLFNLFYISQFSCAALAVKQRFALLNSYIEKFTSDSKQDYEILLPPPMKLDLRLFMELYNNMCDSILIINSTFTPNLIIVMTIFMTIDIFGGYGIVQEFMSPSRNLANLLGSSVWVLLQYPIKIFMAYSGNSTTEEAERTSVLISKLITNTGEHNRQHKDLLNITLHQLQIREKRLCNIFFTINYNLILVVRNCVSAFTCLNFQRDLDHFKNY